MKYLLVVITLLIFFVNDGDAAEDARAVPTKLFGLTLGGIYDVGDSEEGSLGNIPVKKFAGMNSFLGQGVHYYFQPQQESKFFEYVEKREKPSDKYFKTSFRAYLLPVIPTSIKSAEQLSKARVLWEVTHIEWSNDAKSKDDAYFWAIDLCKTMQAGMAVKSKILDFYDSRHYECSFIDGSREFKVSSFYSRSVSLAFTKAVFDRKNNAIESITRKLKAKEILPK